MGKAKKNSGKYEIELQKLELKANLIDSVVKQVVSLLKMGLLVLIFYFLFQSIVIIAHQNPEQISEIAIIVNVVAEAIESKSSIPSVVALLLFILYKKERTSKKRAIRLLGECRKKLEAGDPNRTSSGLTKTGDDPKK